MFAVTDESYPTTIVELTFPLSEPIGVTVTVCGVSQFDVVKVSVDLLREHRDELLFDIGYEIVADGADSRQTVNSPDAPAALPVAPFTRTIVGEATAAFGATTTAGVVMSSILVTETDDVNPVYSAAEGDVVAASRLIVYALLPSTLPLFTPVIVTFCGTFQLVCVNVSDDLSIVP